MKLSLCSCDNHEDLSREAASRIVRALSGKPDLLLCAASGSTPVAAYRLLAQHCARDAEAFRSLRLLKLDEWCGLQMDDPSSCELQMRTELTEPLAITKDRYLGFESDPTDPEAECRVIRAALANAGPIDLCVLGLGTNGHIALNEPASSLHPFAHVARLATSTRNHPMLANRANKPTFGLTLGMAEILTAREILMLVSGSSKRDALRRLCRREISTEFPASFLWLHGNCTLICDRTAAEGVDLPS